MKWWYWVACFITLIIIGTLIYKNRVSDDDVYDDDDDNSEKKMIDNFQLPLIQNYVPSPNKKKSVNKKERQIEKSPTKKILFKSPALGTIDYRKAIFTPTSAPLGLSVKSLANIYSPEFSPKVCSQKIVGI